MTTDAASPPRALRVSLLLLAASNEHEERRSFSRAAAEEQRGALKSGRLSPQAIHGLLPVL